MRAAETEPKVRSVSGAGIRVDPYAGGLDVRFDGHRVWSFQPARDGAQGRTGWLVPWPRAIRPFLTGRTEVTIGPHGQDPVFRQDVCFGDSQEPLLLVDEQGHPLVVDKGGRLQRSFDDLGQETRDLIVENVQRVLRDLREAAGLEAFLSFGCLLGAVRTGRMIGHDVDADVAFLSRHTHPFDIARECRAAVQVMRGLGYAVTRMSAADFKIWVSLPGGRRCGIDVFAGYYFDGLFHMLPNVRGELPREALVPTSTVLLEGREVVAPARPEELLGVIYGAGWRVPDPSFKFAHPEDVTRHMGGYFQGAREGLRYWNEFYRSRGADRVPTEPSAFVRWVVGQVEPGDRFLEVGFGNGRDAVWLASQGHPVNAIEFSATATERAQRLRRAAVKVDGPLAEMRFSQINLNDLHAVLLAGARNALDGQVRHLTARFLLDALPPDTRADFWRFASMVQRRGGLTFLEFRTHRSRGEPTVFGDHRRLYLNPDRVVGEIEERGGHLVERIEGRELARLDNENPDICRLVVRWTR